MADIRISPWRFKYFLRLFEEYLQCLQYFNIFNWYFSHLRGEEVESEYRAAQKARARISVSWDLKKFHIVNWKINWGILYIFLASLFFPACLPAPPVLNKSVKGLTFIINFDYPEHGEGVERHHQKLDDIQVLRNTTTIIIITAVIISLFGHLCHHNNNRSGYSQSAREMGQRARDEEQSSSTR